MIVYSIYGKKVKATEKKIGELRILEIIELNELSTSHPCYPSFNDFTIREITF